MKFFYNFCAVLFVGGLTLASYVFYTTISKKDSSTIEQSITDQSIIPEKYIVTGTSINVPVNIQTLQPQKQPNTANEDKSLGYTSLKKEVAITALPTTGTIPSWLSGTLLRNGPAQFELNGNQFSHWFDGFAMVHRFTINKGTVSYANKFLESSYRRKALEKGKLPSGFNEEKEKSSWFSAVGKLFSKPPVYDNTNVNITKYGSNTIALTETPHAIAFDSQTLKTLGEVIYDDKLDGHIATAHPLIDPETKESFNVLINYGKTSYYQIYKMDKGSYQRKLIASIPTSLPSYVHSFALTKEHIVLILIPLVVNPMDLMFSNKSFIDNFKWKPEYGTELIVIDRKTGKRIGSYKTDPFFFFHIANSYDEKNYIVIDLVAFPDYSVIHGTKLKNLRSNKAAVNQPTLKQLIRLIIDMQKGIVKTKQLGDDALELPRINDSYTGKHHSFIYGVGASDKKLIKLNTKNLHTESWQEAGCFTTEPIFVQKPNCNDEDDGVILSTVLDANNNNSFLLILDAKTMKELGRAVVPHHIPFGFHGQFYSEIA